MTTFKDQMQTAFEAGADYAERITSGIPGEPKKPNFEEWWFMTNPEDPSDAEERPGREVYQFHLEASLAPSGDGVTPNMMLGLPNPTKTVVVTGASLDDAIEKAKRLLPAPVLAEWVFETCAIIVMPDRIQH